MLQEKVSGVKTEMTDAEKALEELLGKKSSAENTMESAKKKADTAKAVEIRNRAMQRTQKRKEDDEDRDVENAQPKPKSTRRSGGDTVIYLQKKNDLVQKLKTEELKLQDVSQKAASRNEKMMAQQAHQQQNQMEQFQQMFVAMQQQQSQIIF